VDLPITRLEQAMHADFVAHFRRHRAESGRSDIHFMPFAPEDEEGPQGVAFKQLGLPLNELGWQRCWVAWNSQHEQIVGHVDLKGAGLRTVMHRCDLGIGIERAWRGGGLGRRLMLQAIEFCEQAPGIDHLDLRVFAHNAPARALYASLGFVEIGTYADWVRIGDASIDDVLMSRTVKRA
jgi:RimJ/RimL family protein N-acetyltransferase